MQDWEKSRNHRDLIAAQNLVQWAAIGLLLPLIGIVIAVMAQQKVNYVVEDKENWEDVRKVRARANFWIAISLIAVLMWLAVWYILGQWSVNA